MSFDPEQVAEAVLQMVRAAVAPVVDDLAKVRAELQLLRVDHADVKARLAALDAAEAPAVPFAPTVQ